MKVGFIGLGAMGVPMAANLLEGGHELHVWARRREAGAVCQTSPGGAIRPREGPGSGRPELRR